MSAPLRCCPHCHAPFRAACGAGVVQLPALKAKIFAMIKAAGDVGISSEEIVYSQAFDRRKRPSRETIRAHVFQLNHDFLIHTNAIIRSDRRRWFLLSRSDLAR